MSESLAQVAIEKTECISEEERIVFLHIPKTAGSSIHAALSSHFHKDEICPERFDGISVMDEEPLSRYRYFSGHFSRRSVARIPGKCKVFTFLRSPEKRILSLYYFWRSHRAEVVEAGNLTGPRFARALNLAEFLECTDPSVTNAIDNAVTRQLVNVDYFAKFEKYKLTEPELLVENVVNYLSEIAFVGFQEEFSSDFNSLFSKLQLPPPASVPSVNTRKTNSAESRFEEVTEQVITDRVQEALQRLTALDQRVYSQALAIVR